jgi:hypothetical protein
MMLHILDYQPLMREASFSSGTKQPRTSVNFTIDGSALLDKLVQLDGDHVDFMGSFVRGFDEENIRKSEQFLGISAADTLDGRVLLYVCPECGDIGCGAYAAKITVSDEKVVWSDFAYENGYEPANTLGAIAPFTFALRDYVQIIDAALKFVRGKD